MRADGSVDAGARVGFGSRDGGIVAPALLEVAQHEWFERTAQRLLRSESVSLFRCSALSTYPDPPGQAETAMAYHTDQQFRSDDWAGTPRRVQVALWLFLSDVVEPHPPNRAIASFHVVRTYVAA